MTETRPLRIVLTLRDLREGGAQKSAVTLAHALAMAGHAVELVLWRAHGPFLAEVNESVRVVDLKADTLFHAIVNLRRHLSNTAPDEMISGLLKPNLAAVLAARSLRRRPVVAVVEHGHLPSYLAEKSLAARCVCRAVLRLTHRLADRVVAVSDPAARAVEQALRHPVGTVRTVYNPIALPPDKRTAPPHPWLEPGQPPVVLSMGRLIPSKGMDVVLEALVRLRTPARLMILGEGPEAEALATQARALGVRERVHFAGFVTHPHAYLRHGRVFVLASRHESFCNALVDALACGLPVVAADCPVGPRVVLEDGRYGTLVPVDDATAFATALDDVLALPHEEAEAKSREQRARAFSPAAAVQAWERLFMEREG